MGPRMGNFKVSFRVKTARIRWFVTSSETFVTGLPEAGILGLKGARLKKSRPDQLFSKRVLCNAVGKTIHASISSHPFSQIAGDVHSLQSLSRRADQALLPGSENSKALPAWSK